MKNENLIGDSNPMYLLNPLEKQNNNNNITNLYSNNAFHDVSTKVSYLPKGNSLSNFTLKRKPNPINIIPENNINIEELNKQNSNKSLLDTPFILNENKESNQQKNEFDFESFFS